MVATSKRNTAMVRVLLELGANIDATNNENKTALDFLHEDDHDTARYTRA